MPTILKSPNPFAFFLLSVSALLLTTPQAKAQDFWEDTVLAGLYRSGNSFQAQSAKYEYSNLSDGSTQSLRDWYTTNSHDLNITLLTEVDENFGLLWGIGTGEAGEKFQIDPSFTLGFVLNQQLDDASSFSLRVAKVFGGQLTETPCTADYGVIGGIQQVNCRMADSFLPPSETLDYLFDEAPKEQLQLKLTYQFRF